jgi:hypothetical protein
MTAVRLAAAACLVLTSACTSAPGTAPRSRQKLASPPPAPFLMFVDLSPGDAFKHAVLAPLSDPSGPVYVTPLVCERVYVAGGRGLCLADATENDLPVRRWAVAFESNFEVRHRFPLYGVPSRVRVSPDGRWAATTLFENGHSYAERGFSTMTRVFDLETKTVAIDDLEELAVTRDGIPFRAADFNFWGVTFARGSDGFYATLASGDRNYLIKGSVTAKTATVIHEGVECPSLSPDNRHIAFKKRIGGARGWWQIVILDLETMSEKPVWSETSSVDDQVEWLDAAHVMYHLSNGSRGADIRVAAIDGSTPPRVLVAGAYSPAVVSAR